jgi:aminoglycoside phosphotransferase (APT) family kinase protein
MIRDLWHRMPSDLAKRFPIRDGRKDLMISRTKHDVDDDIVKKLMASVGLEGATEVAPLGAGEYNAVYAVATDGGNYAVKIAPRPDVPVLTYEHGMMSAELFWYGKMREAGINVPEIRHADFTHGIIPSDWFVMDRIDGTQMDLMRFTPPEETEAFAATARLVARIHGRKNDRFGYVQSGLHDDWYQAIRAMAADLVADAARVHRTTRRGERLLALVDRHRDILRAADCVMVNFDVWPPNILCRRTHDGMEYTWIDPERSFWGDPICDFVCLEMFAPLAEKKATLAAYNAVADHPVRATREERIRYAVAQGYLALIMEVEKYYRYTPLHFGWHRNVVVSAKLYADAFAALERA